MQPRPAVREARSLESVRSWSRTHGYSLGHGSAAHIEKGRDLSAPVYMCGVSTYKHREHVLIRTVGTYMPREHAPRAPDPRPPDFYRSTPVARVNLWTFVDEAIQTFTRRSWASIQAARAVHATRTIHATRAIQATRRLANPGR